jgi:hypothetical protein
MTTFIRRSGAVLTSAGVAAALTLFTPVTANAAVHAMYGAFGQADENYVGPTVGGTCDLSSGDDSVDSSVAHFTHGTKHRSLNLDAAFTSSDSTSDTVRVKGHLASKLTLHRKHKDLTSFTLGVGGKLGVHHSVGGSACSGSGSLLAETQAVFTEHKKGWFYLTHDVKKPNSVIQLEMINVNTDKLVTLDFYAGDQSQLTTRTKLKPGRYAILAEAGMTVGASGVILAKGTSAQKTKMSTTIVGTFKPAKKH